MLVKGRLDPESRGTIRIYPRVESLWAEASIVMKDGVGREDVAIMARKCVSDRDVAIVVSRRKEDL